MIAGEHQRLGSRPARHEFPSSTELAAARSLPAAARHHHEVGRRLAHQTQQRLHDARQIVIPADLFEYASDGRLCGIRVAFARARIQPNKKGPSGVMEHSIIDWL